VLKLGFMLDNLGASQLAYGLVRSLNNYYQKGGDVPCTLFYERLQTPCLRPLTAMMQTAEGWSFDGTMVAFNISLAAKLLHMPIAQNHKHYFFVWDVEWVRAERKAYRAYQPVYSHPNLILLARSADHASLIEDAWNRPVRAVLDSPDVVKLLEIINDDKLATKRAREGVA
jgi:hypothetical protein